MRVRSWSHIGGNWDRPLDAGAGARTLVLAFGAPELGPADDAPPSWWTELRAAFPDAAIVGGSTSGEIHGERVLDRSVAVTVIDFDTTDVHRVTERVADHACSAAIGRSLGTRLADAAGSGDLAAVLVVSDGTAVNGTELCAGLQAAVGPRVAVSGGLAGDGDRFAATWIADDHAVQGGVVTAVGLVGPDLEVRHGSQGGWFPFGPERTVSFSDDGVLHELDGRPALDLYRDYLGSFADQLPAAALLFPLRVWPADGSQAPVVRTVLGVDDATSSMTFAGSMPSGWRAQLMMADPDDLVDAAAAAAEELEPADRDGRGDDRLVVAVSCVGRRLLLGEAAGDELAAVSDALPAGTTLTGFYSYGEISPIDGAARLHNQTMTLTMLAERS